MSLLPLPSGEELEPPVRAKSILLMGAWHSKLGSGPSVIRC